MELQCLNLFGGLPRAENQHTSCQRVEGTGMSHLHPFYMEPFRHQIADMRQCPKARHAIGFVDIDVGSLVEVHAFYKLRRIVAAPMMAQ